MSQQPPDDQLPLEEELPEEKLPKGEPPDDELLDDEELLEDEQLSGTLLGGLYQAAQGLGGFGGALFGGGLFAVVVGGVVYLLEDDLRLHASILLGAGAVLLLLGIITSWPSVSTTLGARRGRYGVNSVVMISAFLGIIGVGTFLAFENVSRMDVTATNQFSLATRTKNLLSNLDGKIVARAFFVQDSPDQQAALSFVEDTLREFDARSSKFSYEIIDPDRDPVVAMDLGVTQYGTIVFQDVESGAVHLVAPSPFLEQDFVTALLIVTAEERKRIYFLTGHQEHSIDDLQLPPEGFEVAAFEGLQNENYSVEPLSLLGATEEVPEDATLVVIAGPKGDFFSGELDALDAYLAGGGRLLVLLDPEVREPGTSDEGLKDLREFLFRWGIEVQPGHIVDKGQSTDESGRTPFVAGSQYGPPLGLLNEDYMLAFYGVGAQPVGLMVSSLVDITRGLDTSFYPGAVSLRPVEGAFFYPAEGDPPQEAQELAQLKELSTVALAITSNNSWRIEDLDRDDPQENDATGPFYLALAVRPTTALVAEVVDPSQSEGPLIMAIGDSDFASNENFYQGSNSDFFLNTVNWLVGDISLVDIRPKPITFRRLVLDENQKNFVRYTSWFLLPAAMALLAGVVWFRRR